MGIGDWYPKKQGLGSQNFDSWSIEGILHIFITKTKAVAEVLVASLASQALHCITGSERSGMFGSNVLLTCKTLLPNMPLLSEPVMQCRTCRTRIFSRSCHCPNLGAAFSLLGYGFPFRTSSQCTWSVRTASRAASGTSRSGGLELNSCLN